PREVPDRVGEPDVREEPVSPLTVEHRSQLGLGALLVEVGVRDRDAPRVPAPLVRVEPGRRAGRVTEPVGVEHLERLLSERGIRIDELRTAVAETDFGQPPPPTVLKWHWR